METYLLRKRDEYSNLLLGLSCAALIVATDIKLAPAHARAQRYEPLEEKTLFSKPQCLQEDEPLSRYLQTSSTIAWCDLKTKNETSSSRLDQQNLEK